MVIKKKKEFASSVSAKSTKQQILEAYSEALKHLEEKAVITPQEEEKKKTTSTLVQKASENSMDRIIADLANLKLSITKQVEVLEEKLTLEFKKLMTLREAIEAEKTHLEEMYSIKESSHTLSALMLAQKEEKNRFFESIRDQTTVFEEEMAVKKESWEREKALYSQENADYQSHVTQLRTREEEEYKYAQKITRQKEEDAYELKKASLDNTLSMRQHVLDDRENVLKEQEAEQIRLKQEIENMPLQIEGATKEAVKKTTTLLESQYKFEKTLREQEVKGDMTLSKQRIQTLEEKLKEQRGLIDHLQKKTDGAMNQVENIANRALDTSSYRVGACYEEQVDEKQKTS